MEITSSFGYWIRRQRKALDLTQQVLADKVGCSLAAIKKIEGDERRPSRQIAERLAEILGVPASQREIFLQVARGLRPVDQLLLAREPAASTLPTGIVTFLFTDIENSTKLAQEHPEEWETLRARHHVILRETIEAHHGYVFQVIGDAFCAAFDTTNDAFQAAIEAQRKLQSENWGEAPICVRMGIHTGNAEVQEDGLYHGYVTLSHVQRVMSVGHGGQVLLSSITQELVQDGLPEGVELHDMGQRQLKDLSHPEHLFQLVIPGLRADFPPLNIPESFSNNLPVQLTSFIGRERELNEITNLIAKNRLVTLSGVGGIGKTRLSIQAGFTLLNDFPTGTWLVELIPLSDPTLVPQVIVNTLGLIEQSGRSPLNILTDFLQSKRALLILDNCEHLIQASAQLAERLLHSCPDLHILATSREALDISGETLYHVPPLISPEPVNITLDTLPQYEAVQLFVERAQSAVHGFSLTPDNAHAIAQICCHLDGIPLALELAAARVKLLNVEEIAARLDDRFHLLTSGNRTAMPRHQTLQALIDWSHDLLSEPERVLLRRLSVFAGEWTIEAAEAVCGGEGIETDEILDLLTQLINKSLVLAAHNDEQVTRFHMLETIRQYSQEKLWAAGEGEIMRHRHLAYFVDLAERAEPNLRAFDMVMWLDRLESDLDNIRAALGWAQESDVEAQLRLASALLWFWHIRGHKNEGVDWLERGLSIETAERGDQPLTPDRAMIRGKALNVAGFLLATLGNFDKGMALLEEALAVFRELGSRGRLGMAYSLLNLADAVGYQEGHRRAKALAEESLTLFREAGDKFGMAQGLGILSWVTWLEGDSDQVKALLEENLALRKEIGDKDGIAYVLAHLGRITFFQGNLSRSVASYEESLAVFREVGNEMETGRTLANLARVAQAQGDYGKATKILEEALALGRDLGDKFRVSQWLDGLGRVAQSQGDYERATRISEEALILAREVGEPDTIARNLSGLGNVALAQGNYPQATRQFEAELSLGQERKINWISAFAFSSLGRVAWAQGNFELASKRLEKALAMFRESGNKIGMVSAIYGLGRVLQSQRDYTSARAHYMEALAIARELGYRASIMEALATLSVAQSHMEPSPLRFENLRHAAHLFGASETLYAPLRFEMSAAERAEHDQAIAAARVALGEEAFTAAWEDGKKMTLEQALALATESESEDPRGRNNKS